MKKVRILITGATGNVGLETIKILVEKYAHLAEIYAAVYNTEEAKKNIPYKDVSFIHLDFTNQQTFDSALSGMDKVLLVRPPSYRTLKKFLLPLLER